MNEKVANQRQGTNTISKTVKKRQSIETRYGFNPYKTQRGDPRPIQTKNVSKPYLNPQRIPKSIYPQIFLKP